jgi:tryptophanyl-tRNA synthetase
LPTKRVLSGVRATGDLHIGNYLGAIQQWLDMQRSADCFFFIADLHGLTEIDARHNAAEFYQRRLKTAATFIASGVTNEQSTLFFQSSVPYHVELMWYLSSIARKGELERMTQWKDKAGDDQAGASAGLFTYPVLMAADILMYGADEVPVGDDQRQHVEVTRDWAERFNKYFGDTFTIPTATIPPQGARVMDLLAPSSKMAKSSGGAGTLFLTDDNDTLRSKVRRAVTDADKSIRRSREKPGITNLINLYGALTRSTPDEVESLFDGLSYGDFKDATADAVIAVVEPIRGSIQVLLADSSYLLDVLDEGAVRARQVAEQTCIRVRNALGFGSY